LGRARYHAADWKGALSALEKARSCGTDEDCDLWLLLALTQFRLGDRNRARVWYDKAIDWLKQHPEKCWSRDPLRDEIAALGGKAEPMKNETREQETARAK
jgi:hypothetical protein